ncbi:methylmalonyl Co-A mutase-associated GTPase MeaB [bacterium]|nr:methylmalonyl Co-A mutase-associated GTPase MeaB [bacterium]
MVRTRTLESVFAAFSEGKNSAVGRLLSILEDGGKDAEKVVEYIFPKIKGVYRVGFTGPPGAGKSTVISRLTSHFREEDKSVGIIVVDPTSPFSGGALLGDRIRMQHFTSDPGVFVRSLASRGSLGGISTCTDESVDILDANGKDIVFIETVGVGQSELEIADKTHTVVVILVPESGDGIQAMKAGLMEIGDIFVMNKSDHQDAEMAAREIQSALKLKKTSGNKWVPRVILTCGLKDEGVDKLKEAIHEHRDFLDTNNLREKKNRQILFSRVRNALLDRLERRIKKSHRVRELLDKRMEEVYAGEISPYSVVYELEKMINIE